MTNWENETEDAIYFWGGIFSNWAKYKFITQLKDDLSMEFRQFNCVEQYMMASKAFMFGDEAILGEIMDESDPKKQKALGRKVSGFDDSKWRASARDIVYVGVYQKFSQNADIKDLLLSTDSKLLVEASAKDTIWGIGLAPFDHGVEDITKWKGTNWLGQVLMRVRADLRNGVDNSFTS